MPSQVSVFHMGAPSRGPEGGGQGLKSEVSVPPMPPRPAQPHTVGHSAPALPLPPFTLDAPEVPGKHRLLSGLWALVHTVPPTWSPFPALSAWPV